MGDFKKEWYALVVIPSGEPFEYIHTYTFEKVKPLNLVSEYRFT